MVLGIISALSTAVAEVSAAAVTAASPVLGGIVTKAASSIGASVGGALSDAGVSSVVGGIAGNTTTTAINGAAYRALSSDD